MAIAHAIMLFIVLWQVSNSSYSSALDEGLLGQIAKLERQLLNTRPPGNMRFIFVNVSYDIKLAVNPEGGVGSISITDRETLARFFKLLADKGNRHQFVLSDIFLEYPEDEDSTLLVQAGRCKNLLFPYHLISGKKQEPCIPVNTALSDFETYTGNFSKFRLIYDDSMVTTPVAILNKLDHKRYPNTWLDFKSILPRYYINPSELGDATKYPVYNLGELLMIAEDDSVYHQFLEDRFIVLGNFETDLHNSPVGRIPGPLILLNTYLTINNGRSVSWWWAIFMTIGLTGVSYLLFFGKLKPPESRKYPWLDLLYKIFINKYFSFSGLFLLLVLLSSILFSVRPNISLVLMYVLTFNFFKEFYLKHYKKKVDEKIPVVVPPAA